MRANVIRVILTITVVAFSVSAQTRGGAARPVDLAGTSWQLVKLQGGDEETSVPDDGSKYTITFGKNGRVTSRVDCNRGSSTWKLKGSNELEFGSWSMTRAKCPPGSLHDRIVTEGAAVRYFSIKNGHLFLSGMAAGGYYELEPLTTRR